MKCRFGMFWRLGAAGGAAGAGAVRERRELRGREVRRRGRAKCWLRRGRARESIEGFWTGGFGFLDGYGKMGLE